MMNKISSCLKWTWLGGPSPGLCHATMTEVAPPVASVVRSTFMSRPKGLIDNACLGVTTAGCSGVRACMDVVSGSSRPFSSKRCNIATLAQKIVIFTAASYLWDDADNDLYYFVAFL